MASNLESMSDVQPDAKIVASPLLNEVHQDLAKSSTTDIKSTDYLKSAETKVNELFGSLHITGDDFTGPSVSKPLSEAGNGLDTPDKIAPIPEGAAKENPDKTGTPIPEGAAKENPDKIGMPIPEATKDSHTLAGAQAPDVSRDTTAAALTSALEAHDNTQRGATAPSPEANSADNTRAAATIEEGFHWYKTDDFDKVTGVLQGKTPEQIKGIDDAFKNTHDGKGIEETLNDRWKDHPDQLAKAKELLHPKDATPPAKPEETSEEIKAKDANALDSLKKDPEVQAKHDEMAKQAKETMKEPALTKFLGNMDKFEEREASVQRQYEKENESKGMTPDQAAKGAEQQTHDQVKDSYSNIEKLLAKDPNAKVNEQDRAILAQQTMQHAAEPTSISQGSYGTCTAATIETRTFTRDPAEATRLVSEVATSGQYTPANGKPITLDSQSLHKQGDATQPSSDTKENQRDFASQLFEVTAANVYLQHKNESTNPPGQLKYEQHARVPGKNPPSDDQGERLMDYSTKPATVVKDGISMSPEDVAYVSKQISPKGSEGTVAIDSFHIADLQKQLLDIDLRHNGINDGKPVDLNDADWAKKAHDSVNGKAGLDDATKDKINKEISDLDKQSKEDKEGSVVHVHNEQEMKDTLKQLSDNGKLPVVVAVDTNNEPFWSDSRGGDAGGSGGPHVVTITDYDSKTGTAKIENQWDGKADHNITAKQLFEATRTPGQEVPDLTKEVKADADSGHRDYVKEYELLRLEKSQGKISDAEFDKQAVQQTLDRYHEFKDGKVDPSSPEYQAANKEFALMRDNLKRSTNPADHTLCQNIEAEIAAGMKS